MEPPEGYHWHQRDALELVCEACGATVSADVVDLHDRFDCPGGA